MTDVPPAAPRRGLPAEVREQIQAAYRAGQTARQIARALRVKTTQVDTVIARAGMRRPDADRRSPSWYTSLPERAREAILTDYRTGLPIADIRVRHGITGEQLRIVLRRSGTVARRPAWTVGKRANVVIDHLDGATMEELVAKYGFPADQIRAVLASAQDSAAA